MDFSATFRRGQKVLSVILHSNRQKVNCRNGSEGMTWDWSKVFGDDSFDESWLDNAYFGFGQLRKEIWKVEPRMKYVMLKTNKDFYSDNWF